MGLEVLLESGAHLLPWRLVRPHFSPPPKTDSVPVYTRIRVSTHIAAFFQRHFLPIPRAVNLKALKHLDLSGCPYIDDWSLSRLHVFRDTLQELSLAGCPQVSEKGLACLHHLE